MPYFFFTGGDNSAFTSPMSQHTNGAIHSAFMSHSNPFSMEALLNRPPLTAGVIPPVSSTASQRLSAHRQFSFPPPAVSSAASSMVNQYLNYPLPPTFPGAAAITPFFMSQLAAISSLNHHKPLSEKLSEHDNNFSDDDSKKQ